MPNEVIERVVVDPNYEAYSGFFDFEWCKQIVERVHFSKLQDPTDKLIMSWRSTNGAHRLPWLMVMQFQHFAAGMLNGSIEFRGTYSERIIHGLVNKLCDRMPVGLKPEQRASLRRTVTQIEREANQGLRTAEQEPPFDVSEYWSDLLDKSEFQFSIFGTQGITYGAIFFAYEDFLANVMRTVEPDYSTRGKQIDRDLERLFGKTIADSCWNDPEVQIAKLVRNSLAHNGCRFGQTLEPFRRRFLDVTDNPKPPLHQEKFVLINDKIQITPGNNKHLFDVLKSKVIEIVAEVLELNKSVTARKVTM